MSEPKSESTSEPEPTETTAACPKCGERLVYVTSMPHPKSPAMRRTTFVCYPCNRTWSYTLAPAMAEAYATGNPAAAAV
jgi:DNA-directed RNA polymerase subunit M/transcription elongation factor TFIIS